MTDVAQVIDRYIAIWNEPDPGRRRDLISRTWTEEATYVDPMVAAEGHAAIGATVAAAREQFPGLEFRLAGPVDAHHDVVRFTWELGPVDDPESLVVGFDVAVQAEDGRLRQVIGFLDKVPAALIG